MINLITVILLLFIPFSTPLAKFTVPESAPVGHVIGFISGRREDATATPNYFVVFPDEQTSKFLKVDEKSGEISTVAPLDYEKRAKFEIVAVRVAESGETIDIIVEVDDENDNAPSFSDPRIKLEISEFVQLGTSFALPTVTDGDGPKYDVHRFVIVQGNVNNVFKINTRKVNEQLQADLVVNGHLDREFRDKYELLIEAEDGGKPAKTGQLRCSIEIIDANDNAPVFTRSRYTASVSANVSMGANIITVQASDADIGENSRITYEIKKTTSPSNANFAISPSSGVISTVAHLLPASTHDVIVVASDHGTPPLTSSAVVTISVMGSSLASPPLDIIWLADSNSAHLPENSTLGSIVARVSVAEEYRDTKLRLDGTTALCPQQTDQSHVYLLLLCGILDRETTAEHHLKFSLEKDGATVVEHPQLLTIGDVNDNAPVWTSSGNLNLVHISLNRTQGGSRTLTARDPDLGQNGWIKYSILDTDLISIDKETGRIFVPNTIDCNVGSEIKFRIRAEDGGTPPLASDLNVVADLVDTESKPPQFEKALWQVEIAEDTPVGTCLVKVVANNSQCGSSKRIRYSMQDKNEHLTIDSLSGTVCIQKTFDYETTATFQTTVVATNSNSETSTSLISIRLLDVNDNWPIFYPNEYHLTIREGPTPSSEPLLVVSASDLDSGKFGDVTYQILSESASFNINPISGEIFAKKNLSKGRFHLVVSAKDGGGQTAENPANVHITVIDKSSKTPEFSSSKYEIKTTEDILPGIAIGSVAAISEARVKYSIYSGDPEHAFSIDEDTGKIYVTRYLDADIHDTVLLNVQATMDGGQTNQTQVLIRIEDHNDNSPVFSNSLVEISVREDQPSNEPFYVVHATDKDKKQNGAVKYSILSHHPTSSIEIDPSTGQIFFTTQSFDYESIRDYKLRIKASDGGIPSRSANMTLFVHITDVNDNAPRFEKSAYFMEVVENSPPKTTVGKVVAHDKDSSLNGQVKYRITNGSEYFGIDEKLGAIYTKRSLDREVISHVDVSVVAEDLGSPSLSGTTNVRVTILDVNDNPPSCHSITPIVVPANAPPSTSIGTIVATDPDKGLNGSVLYRAQLQSALFVIKANGDVYLRRSLNASEEYHQRLSVIVSDQGTPRKSTVCHVAVRVAKGSSSVVLIEPVQRFVQIPSTCRTNTTCRLIGFNATGVATWQIQSSDISNHFAIRDGVLSMTSLPSHRPPYSLVVILSDSNGRQKSVQMRIVATGEESMNKEETIRILDTTGIGAKIGRLGEKTSDIFYRFSSSNLSCPLELDQTGGILYLVEGIRARAQQDSNFSCFFEKFNTTDGSSDEMRVDLEISRSKSGKPIFDTDHITIKTREDTPTGTIITTVNATADDDSTTPISYRFTSQIDTFAIDQFTGDITLVENLHWHVKPIHQLVVEAFTNGIATTLLVTVHVEDVNDHSPFIVSQPTILLPSSFRKGAVVHRVVAIDLDHSDSLKYSVVSISELFKIDNSTGEVSILTSSDAEFPENLKTLKIRVEDVSDSTKFDEQEILIRGSKSNDSKSHWHFFDQQKSTVEVEPNTPKDTVVAVFPQGGASLRMIPTSSYFELRGSEVIVKGTGASSSQKFTILAENHSGEHDWTVLEILVPKTDENPPKIASTSCGVATIEENKEYGAFKRIMATGLTRESKFRFQGKTPLFTIHPTTGEISSKRLDRELTQEHLLVIILTDSGRNDSCTVRVQVADQNDNAPQFMATPIELTINESSRVGDVLHRFQASDMDIGLNGKFSFELIDDPSRSLDVVPETGALVIRRSVSMEEWTIKVRVFDGGAPSLSSEVSVKIDNRGGKSSKGGIASSELEFLRQSYVSSIDESLPRGQFVSKLELTTEDLAGTTYSIVEGNTDSAFSIDSDGVIRTNLELDKEIVDRYHLKVIAIGGKQQQASTRIDVRVNNLNDNQPSFPVLKPRRLSETLKVGSYVASVSAKDVDQIAPLEYFLEPDDTTFHVDRFTGVIHLASPLDYETRKEHTLRLRVTDGQFDTRTNLTIFVSDVNDNAPVFTKNFYATQVSPAAYSPETPFAIIEASDADSGPAGQVTYSLDESPMFRVSPTDGALFLKVLPPSGERYVVTVVATDGGVPAMRTSVPVSVLIGEIEPTEKPGFERNEFKFELLENTRIGMQIGNVSGENREFLYRIQDPDATKAFTIDRFGRLFVAGPIDRETRQFYEFTVEIDSEMTSFNRQKAQCKVHVVIMDENDNAPKFTSSVIHVSLKDTMTHGQTIGQLVADDVDSAENGRVSYRILTGNDYNIVTLNTDTGAIQFNEWNDAQLDEHLPNATWNILVEARDHGHPYKISVASVMVSLKLSSWSGSAPFFVLPAYEVHVLENTPIGTVVQKVRASNRLGMVDTGLLYSLKEHQGRLSIDVKSGELTLKTHLDWESEPLLTMYLSVSDGNGRSAVVPLKIHVEPVDEFAPVFTRPSYRIQIPTSTSVGDSVGQIQAIDEDGGPHGHVRYSISNQQDTLKIEEETGTLRLAKSLTSHRNLTHEQITVVAYSSPSKLVKTTVHLEIGPFETTPSIPRLLNSKPVQIAAASLILLLILLVIVICVCMCRAKNGASMEKPAPLQSRSSELEHPKSKSVKPSLQKQVYSVKTGEIRTLSSDIHHQLTNSMTSSASTSSDALRIIRGSSRSQMDSGIDPDTVSINSSVTDYLVSLGVNANPIPPRIRPNTTYDSLMNEYIYARVEDVLPPGPISLTTSNQHSLLRQPLSTGSIASRLPPIVPSFEPITEIFKETIEKRAEHHAHHPRKEYVQVEI